VNRRAAAWGEEGEGSTAAQRRGQLMSEGCICCCMRGNMRRMPLHVEAAQNTRRAGPGRPSTSCVCLVVRQRRIKETGRFFLQKRIQGIGRVAKKSVENSDSVVANHFSNSAEIMNTGAAHGSRQLHVYVNIG
jgi:hypothetical protein